MYVLLLLKCCTVNTCYVLGMLNKVFYSILLIDIVTTLEQIAAIIQNDYLACLEVLQLAQCIFTKKQPNKEADKMKKCLLPSC